MQDKIILTGVTPSGIPHLGNYVGAIRPAIHNQYNYQQALYFIPDYHSLIKLQDAKLRQHYILHNAATWLALGLDADKTIFYRQSQVPEITELAWILSTVTAKGLLNRAHAYKDLTVKNLAQNEDPDAGISMGLFNYPVLMAADILAFNAHYVPVGKDQIQHIEIARDIAMRFNHIYGETFVLPEAIIDEKVETLPGLDGRKMSKSYQNTIPIFLSSKDLRKLIMKITTNSQTPEEPKSTENCTLFTLYQAFAKPEQTAALAQRYAAGIGWGEVKQMLFELIDQELNAARERYDHYVAHPSLVEEILAKGAEKARNMAAPILKLAKEKAGL
jgi:tryptophanyl-tRNA synthetase